jgi:Ca2+-binding EF-hand superfamily protein
MGVSHSYMNMWALSAIMRITEDDIEKIHDMFDKDQVKEGKSSDSFVVTEVALTRYLQEIQAIKPDVEVFLNLFRLIDNRGFGTIDIRDLLISVTALTATSVPQCLEKTILIVDRNKTSLIDKLDLFNILRLLNDTCYYFGDKYLSSDQLHDLIDSTYTSAGMIDGTIYYPNFIEYISTHPIVELFLSPQFQGGVKGKILTDEALEKFVFSER